MNVVELLNLLRQNQEAIWSLGGGIVGWYGNLAKNRLQRQRNEIDVEQLENEQLRLALEREKNLTELHARLLSQNENLWERFYNREEVLKTYHTAALQAQRLVNELEIRANLPVTLFPDLPDFPPESGSKIAGAPADERGERYAQLTDTNCTSTTSRPVGGRKAAAGETDNCPPAGD